MSGNLGTLSNFVEVWISDESASELNTGSGYNTGFVPHDGSTVSVTILDGNSQPIASSNQPGAGATEFKTQRSAY